MRRIFQWLTVAAAIFMAASAVAADDRSRPNQPWPMMPGYGMAPGYPMGPGYHMGQGYPGPYGMGPGYHMSPGYGMPYGPHMGYGMMGPGGYGQATIDRDGDGIISESEAADHFDAAFGAMDSDDDGKLTADEFASVWYGRGPHMAWHGDHMQAWRERKDARFKEIDANGDGTVTEMEFLDYTKKRFENSDADKDGKVTVWEFRSHRYF